MKVPRSLAKLRTIRRKEHGTKPEDLLTIQNPASLPDTPVLSRRSSLEMRGGGREHNFFDHLHTDLLIMIFSILQSLESPWKSEGRKWIKVTHVCRKWRQLLLAFPSLWTYVDTKWGTMASEFIARSGDSPLKLRIHFRESASLPEIMAVNLAFAHITRACELHLHFHRVEQLLDTTRSLKLHDRSTHLETISLHSESEAQFPHRFFWEFHSTIRRLETSGVCLPSNFDMFRQLTHLKMDFECQQIPSPVAPHDILNMLGCCVKLVDIEFCTFTWVLEPPYSAPIIALRFVRRICFAYSYSTCIGLLDHLILPPAVSLIIKDSRVSGFPFPSIPSSLFSPPYNACLVNIWSPINQIVASRVSSPHDMESCIDVHFSRLTSHANPSLGLEIFRTGFLALLPHLEHLTITLSLTHPLLRATRSWSVAEMATVLASMPNLTTLTLEDYFFKPNCSELAENLLDALHMEQSSQPRAALVVLVCIHSPLSTSSSHFRHRMTNVRRSRS
ncbi:hypothetical protein BD410DRAFT_844779 [Rickenella mellea]|uniref:Uncharacterized protein n=1 Tax=Rickenella mellea TaxID=50990 RepID=A0A4Y7PKE2_9AGAM|nr:hypothetical protein BD410DRAFT_844779 [Rickenella mellea]